VILVHGFGEHAGSYDELAESLGQAGYTSAIYSQRGHGEMPDKQRGVIPSYLCLLDDLDVVTGAVREQTPAVPVALYGHSMGGNIAANYLLRNSQSGFACAVLESPWFSLYKEVSPLTSGLAKVVGAITSRAAIINKLAFSDITGDAEKAKAIENDPLYHNRISLRLFAGIKDGCAYALKNASRLTVPTFLAYAAQEKIVGNPAILQFAERAGDIVTLKEYGCCHAIHNDVERKELYKDMIAFLDAHCPPVRHA
jgi:alpha-beta hydrolase superfamily lysophospholipase